MGIPGLRIRSQARRQLRPAYLDSRTLDLTIAGSPRRLNRNTPSGHSTTSSTEYQESHHVDYVKMIPRFYTRLLLLLLPIFCFGTLLLVLNYVNDTKPSINAYSRVEEILQTSLQRETHFDKHEDEDKESSNDKIKKFWFFKGGSIRPEKSGQRPKLFPEESTEDRIIEQLMYIPEDYDNENTQEKIILAFNGLRTWNKPPGSETFQECPVSRCTLTSDKNLAEKADALLFKDRLTANRNTKRPDQVWILYYLESPVHVNGVAYKDAINWTATYRHDSDIVAPYEKWTYYDPQVRRKVQSKDYSEHKTKKVAWFVSNCAARNNRLEYAIQLNKSIPVDIFGACGPFTCPRHSQEECLKMLRKDYKFYLAFENSNCYDYITEKFFVNSLWNDVVPIAMGARREDYERSAPEKSFIHVDDFSGPEEMAEYLKVLDKDDDLYNSYFEWKGTGEFINTYFWCRLCAMLHAPKNYKHYEDVNAWWKGKGVCVAKSYTNKIR